MVMSGDIQQFSIQTFYWLYAVLAYCLLDNLGFPWLWSAGLRHRVDYDCIYYFVVNSIRSIWSTIVGLNNHFNIHFKLCCCFIFFWHQIRFSVILGSSWGHCQKTAQMCSPKHLVWCEKLPSHTLILRWHHYESQLCAPCVQPVNVGLAS